MGGNDLNRVVPEVRADGATATSYAYDTAGRLVSSSDPNSQKTSWTYSHDDLVTRIAYTNALTPTGPIIFGYDSVYRRLTSRTDDAGTTSYAYEIVVEVLGHTGDPRDLRGPYLTNHAGIPKLRNAAVGGGHRSRRSPVAGGDPPAVTREVEVRTNPTTAGGGGGNGGEAAWRPERDF